MTEIVSLVSLPICSSNAGACRNAASELDGWLRLCVEFMHRMSMEKPRSYRYKACCEFARAGTGIVLYHYIVVCHIRSCS